MPIAEALASDFVAAITWMTLRELSALAVTT